MNPLQRGDLMSLEEYATERDSFRKMVMEHKKHRSVFVGDHVMLAFEDRLTIQYQIQEMLRVERIFEAEGIEDELNAYNPLIPEGKNLKATMMIEYQDVEERKKALSRLVGIESALWLQVDDREKVVPIANEDLERSTGDKTSAVHFLRFELTDEMNAALKDGAELTIGISHPQYEASTTVSEEVRQSLTNDLD